MAAVLEESVLREITSFGGGRDLLGEGGWDLVLPAAAMPVIRVVHINTSNQGYGKKKMC